MNLVSQRLTLREFTANDAHFTMELLNSPAWIQFIGDRNIKKLSDAQNYIEKSLIPHYQQQGFGLYLVSLTEKNTPIGMCGFVKRSGLSGVDIGFALLPQYEGLGYAHEAAQTCMMYGQQTLHLQQLFAITNVDNHKSIKLIQKLGFEYQQELVLPNENEPVKVFMKTLYSSI